MRFRNIEFRWSAVNKKYELIKWYKARVDACEEREYCYVIAFFDKDKKGYYDLRTVGDRFFEDKDAFVVGKHGIRFLNETFEIEKQEEDD